MSRPVHDEAQAFLAAWFDTRRIVQAMNFNRFQQEGLSASQFIVLNLLGEGASETSAADLARALNVDVTTTMRTAASLTTRGLLRKKRDPADRRRSVFTLTAAGRGIHARMHRAFIDHVGETFAAMSPRARSGLVRGLAAFVTAAARSGRERDRG